MMEIAKIEASDLPDLALLFEELAGKPTDLAIMQQSFEWMDHNEDYIVLGAKDHGKLVGSLMGIVCHDLVGSCQPFMVIENVIVAREFRGRGIGRKLMAEIEKTGRERNCYYIMFVSGANRKEAHRFYAALGYGLDEVQGFKKYLR